MNRLCIKTTTIIDVFIVLYINCILILTYSDAYFRIANMIAIILIAMLMIYSIKKRYLYFGTMDKLLLTFLIICYLSLLWSKIFDATFTKCITLTELIILTILLYNYLYFEKKAGMFLKTVTWACAFLALYTILYYGVTDYFIGIISGGRMGEDIQNVNQIGLSVGYAVLIMFWEIVFNGKKSMILPAAICFIVVLGSGSRTALIAVILGLILLYLLKGNSLQKIKSLIQIIIILSIIFAILQLPAFSTLMDRMNILLDAFNGTADKNGGTALRMQLIEAGLQQFLDTPFTGVGIGATGVITSRYLSGWYAYLHNNYAELLASIGIFGTMSYYALWIVPSVRVFRSCIRQVPQAVLIIVICFYTLLTEYGTVDYSVKFTYVLFILIFLLAHEVELSGKENE